MSRRRPPSSTSRPLLPALAIAAWAFAAAAAGAEQAARVEVGQVAPAVRLTATDGEVYDRSELEGEAKLVLVFFRGSW